MCQRGQEATGLNSGPALKTNNKKKVKEKHVLNQHYLEKYNKK